MYNSWLENITLQELWEIDLCDRTFQPGQCREVDRSRQWITNKAYLLTYLVHTLTIRSVKKLRRFKFSHCVLYSLYGCPLVDNDVKMKYLLTSRHINVFALPPPLEGACTKYCDEYVCFFVCLSVCPSTRITQKPHGQSRLVGWLVRA